jgi:hypothetical protein
MTTASIDRFAILLLSEAKAYLEAAIEASASEKRGAYLHASLLVGFCAFEAHLNAIAELFWTREDLSLLDLSILRERKLSLINGTYELLDDEFQMFRLEDRVQFLFARFSSKPLDKESGYWGEFKSAIRLRNALTHPKTASVVDIGTVERALEAILDLLNALYKGIYGRPYPGHRVGVRSDITL